MSPRPPQGHGRHTGTPQPLKTKIVLGGGWAYQGPEIRHVFSIFTHRRGYLRCATTEMGPTGRPPTKTCATFATSQRKRKLVPQLVATVVLSLFNQKGQRILTFPRNKYRPPGRKCASKHGPSTWSKSVRPSLARPPGRKVCGRAWPARLVEKCAAKPGPPAWSKSALPSAPTDGRAVGGRAAGVTNQN